MSALKIVRITLIGTLAIGAFVACGNDNTAQPLPKRTTTATTPSAPAEPAALREHSEAGVEAAARYYIDLLNYAKITGETTGLEQLSLPSCSSCKNQIKRVRDLYDHGSRIDGGRNDVLRVQIASFATGLVPTASLDLDIASERDLGASGEVLAEYDGARVQFVYTVVWDGNSWHIGAIENAGDLK